MARLIEQVIAIKLSRIVKDDDDRESVLSDDQASTLVAAIPELTESVVNDAGVVVEVIAME
jgi:hypothetical protein